MLAYKKEFIELALAVGALKFGEFKLKSGRLSPYFFNSGMFASGQAAAILGKCYAEAAIGNDAHYDMLFGPAYKGIPLAALASAALAEHHDRDLPYCFNRKEAKAHGEGGIIVGNDVSQQVMIIDDVITAGTAIREAVDIIEAAGGKVSGVLLALDRQEKGQGKLSAVQEVEQQLNVPIFSIIQLSDLISHLEQAPEASEMLNSVLSYRECYGV